jgi:transposase InsO family protein
LVTDNGPPFSSREFSGFMTKKGVKIKNSPEYHPESNGLAERAVQTVKESFKKYLYSRVEKTDVQNDILTFVSTYRRTPTSVTEKSPAEIMFSFIPNNILGLMNERSDVEAEEPNKEITKVKQKFKKNGKIERKISR